MERWREGRTRVAGALGAAILAATLAAAAVVPARADDAVAQPAAAVGVGDALPALALKDQHGEPVPIGAATRLVLFSRDMDGGGHVKEALAEDGRARLESRGAVYVADVSRMPGFVLSTFALPSMRRRPYPIALDETGSATAALPGEEGKATILVLENGRIASIAFAGSAADVLGALQ